MTKIKFIYGLAAILIALIFVNIIFDIADKFTEEKPVTEISKVELDDFFHSEISKFGIDEEWISKKRIWDKPSDSCKYYYRIKVPVQLTIPEIILELKNNFSKFKNVQVQNEEFQINGKSQFEVFSNKTVKLKAQFEYDNSLVRQRPNVSFIVSGIEDLSESSLNRLLEISYPCAITLVPGDKFTKLVSSLSKYDKDFVVLINDNISDEKYELDPSFSKRRIKRSIINIANDYKISAKFFVDQNSDLFKSLIFSYVKDEFRRKKITLYRFSTLKNVSEKSESEKLSFLQFHFNDVESRERKIFNITAEDYINLQPYIEKFKMKGNRFLPLSKD